MFNISHSACYLTAGYEAPEYITENNNIHKNVKKQGWLLFIDEKLTLEEIGNFSPIISQVWSSVNLFKPRPFEYPGTMPTSGLLFIKFANVKKTVKLNTILEVGNVCVPLICCRLDKTFQEVRVTTGVMYEMCIPFDLRFSFKNWDSGMDKA